VEAKTAEYLLDLSNRKLGNVLRGAPSVVVTRLDLATLYCEKFDGGEALHAILTYASQHSTAGLTTIPNSTDSISPGKHPPSEPHPADQHGAHQTKTQKTA
jgi:hypothetical protein